MDTQALTPRGWRTHDDLTVGDAIYGFDPVERRIVPATLTAINRFAGPRDAIAIVGEHSEFTTTLAHRHVVLTRDNVVKMTAATALNGGQSLICAASERRPRKQRPFSDEFISLAAWVMAEGSYRPNDEAIVLCQSRTHNPDYCAYLNALVDRFPGTIRHSRPGAIQTWRICHETAWALRQWMPDKVPSAAFIARMCNSNRRRFLYEFIRGDGHAGGCLPDPALLRRSRDFAPHGVTPRAFQKSEQAISALQMMAVLCGLRTTARKVPHGHLLTIFSAFTTLSLNSKEMRPTTLEGAWCPTTTAGTWICRQNGQTFVTGNSHPVEALEYVCTRLYGEGLTSRALEDEDQSAVYLPGDDGRSTVTGY